MRVQLSPGLIKKLKRKNIRIRQSFKRAMILFSRDHLDPQLDNHELKREWKGFRSIDVASDYRAIYEEMEENGEKIAYFIDFGTHQELYQKSK